MSPAAVVSLLTLGVTKSISSWLLVEVTMSLGSTSFTFFLFRFGFDGAGGYKKQIQSGCVCVLCSGCTRVCLYV